MEMRGRNRKWLGTGNGGTVRKVGLVVVFEFSAWVEEHWRGHISVGSEYGCGNRRRSVDGEKGSSSGKLMADFLFLNVEEMSDVLDHLLMGER